MNKEEKFYQILEDIFAGAKIEGKGGFVNLMKIKHGYYSQIKKILDKDIDVQLRKKPKFREEIFNKLYSFFNRYFSESGSIYFNSTPFHNNIYERVYTEEQDVSLFWKTNMLYYVKTDSIFRSIEINPNESDGYKLFFDVSNMGHKKANEKNSVVYIFKNIKDRLVNLEVSYSKKGQKTDIDAILKSIKEAGLQVKAEDLERGFHLFEKQTKVDYFINKNAKEFLMEQFKLWSYQYFWQEDNEWTSERIEQLRILKIITYKIIDFISQFENELGKIWNKPKFVRKSNYVITLDRIIDKGIVKKIIKHLNFNKQLKEWQEMGIVEEEFSVKDIDNSKYAHLPIDTKYFLDLKFEILFLFDDLDNQLDGWLIKSENYQALNTILPKFKEKVQVVYIDPPFNTGNDFEYIDRFQDSTWLTLMDNRLGLSKEFINQSGSIFLHLDWNAQHLGRILLSNIFSKKNFINEIIWRIGWVSGYKTQVDAFVRNHDTIFIFTKNSRSEYFFKKKESKIKYSSFRKDTINNELESIYNKWGVDKQKITNVKVAIKDDKGKVYKIGLKTKDGAYNIEDTWNASEYEELHSNKIKRNVKEYTPHGSELTQKPEQLLKRIISLTTKHNDLVLDFFMGSGTTIASAHKLQRRWVGIEMGNYFESDILFRMKQVLAGIGRNEPCGISKEVNWNGGGFFKYYELEQYEDALSKCKYADSDVLDLQVGASPYQEYVFMRDEKMTEAITIDYKNNKVKVDLSALYPDIDIAETLSNLKGKNIKKITDNEVEFEDGTKINTQEIDYKEIKPLIWWE